MADAVGLQVIAAVASRAVGRGVLRVVGAGMQVADGGGPRAAGAVVLSFQLADTIALPLVAALMGISLPVRCDFRDILVSSVPSARLLGHEYLELAQEYHTLSVC